MMPTAPAAGLLTTAGDPHSQLGKSITRLLQHSVLQLCNEHISYNQKLQVLGVLCITVDDEQHEMVVKVNNTLKRVNPTSSAKESYPYSPAAAHTGSAEADGGAHRRHGVSLGNFQGGSGVSGSGEVMNLSGASGGTLQMTSSPLHTPAPSLLFPRETSHNPSRSASPDGRKGHERKGMNPVKVHHVYDEGELISKEEDHDNIITVIPTDPDTVAPLSTSPSTSANISPMAGTKAPSVETESRSASSIRRKAGFPYRLAQPNDSDAKDETPPTIRALLLAGPRSQSMEPQRSSDTPLSFQGAPDEDSSPSFRAPGLALPLVIGTDTTDAEGYPDTTSQDGVLDFSKSKRKHQAVDAECGELDEDDEEDDDVRIINQTILPGLSENGIVDRSDYGADVARDSLMSPGFSGLYDASPGARSDDGLSIRYTNTGPITVGSNGKSVSQSTLQKVKDIILYDDSSSPSNQKGSRIETGDYMLDSFGLEGSGTTSTRKRRRRAPDEALTTEEIAEYLGFSPGLSTSTFTCRYCNEEVQELSKYLLHTLTAHNAYICHQCGKSFTTKSSLLRHRPIHTGLRRFACSICKKTFYRKDKCKAHIKRHLGVNSDPDNIERYQKIEPIE